MDQGLATEIDWTLNLKFPLQIKTGGIKLMPPV